MARQAQKPDEVISADKMNCSGIQIDRRGVRLPVLQTPVEVLVTTMRSGIQHAGCPYVKRTSVGIGLCNASGNGSEKTLPVCSREKDDARLNALPLTDLNLDKRLIDMCAAGDMRTVGDVRAGVEIDGSAAVIARYRHQLSAELDRLGLSAKITAVTPPIRATLVRMGWVQLELNFPSSLQNS